MISFQGSKTGGSPHVGRKFEGPHIGQNHMPTAALLHEAKLGEALLLTLFLHLSLTKLFALAMFPQFQPSHWFVSYNFLVWRLESAARQQETVMIDCSAVIPTTVEPPVITSPAQECMVTTTAATIPG